MRTSIVDRTFIDTNILIFANLADAPEHQAAFRRVQPLITGREEGWISRQILREYLAGMTRPGALTGSIPIESLIQDVRGFATNFRVADEGPSVTEQLLTLLQQFPAAGKQIHDANIVATMLVYGVPRLLTHNGADFARYAPLITIEPLF